MIRRSPYYQIKTGTRGKILVIKGKGFDYETSNGLYLSSSRFNGNQVYCDFYSNQASLSSFYPPFSGYPVTNFSVIDNNTIQFALSAFDLTQKIDIIYAGPSGYVKASDGLRFTYIQIVSGFNINLYVNE